MKQQAPLMNNKEIDQLNNTMKAAEQPPLDPSVERVRKKLMRLMLSTIVITIVLLFAVLVAIVYKIIAPTQNAHNGVQETSPNQTNNYSHVNTGNERPVLRQIHLDGQWQVLSYNLSGNRVLLAVDAADGKKQIIIYDYELGKTIAIISVVD